MSIQLSQFRVMIQDLAMKSLSQGVETQLCTEDVAQTFCEGILKGQDPMAIAQSLFGLLKPEDQTEKNLTSIQGWVEKTIAAQAAVVAPEAQSLTAKLPVDCEISAAGIQFIKDSEGFKPYPYNDLTKKEMTSFEEVGKGYPTVGYGHKITSAAEFEKYKNGLDEMQATELLMQDLQDAKQKIINKVAVPLEQNQYDALMSFVFNVGEKKSPKLFEKLNAKDYQGAAHEFSDVVKSGDEILSGLVNRRADEIEFFLMGDAKRDYW